MGLEFIRRVLPDAIECVAFSDKTSAAQKFLNMLLELFVTCFSESLMVKERFVVN